VERSGSGDADRTLALLWRAGTAAPAPARGRKPTHTVTGVVRAAIAVADQEGLAQMSMGRVARHLAAAPMSLYTYVPGKAELLDLMVDTVLADLDLPAPEAAPRDWRERIELYAERVRAMYASHPWLVQISQARPPLGPGQFAQQEYLYAALAGTGLPPRQIRAAVESIALFVGATAARDADAALAERATGQSQDAWWAARDGFWTDYFDVTRFPTICRMWEQGAFDPPPLGPSDLGLHRLLDGIAAAIPPA
jgi:AcrR family transcriptional regulator